MKRVDRETARANFWSQVKKTDGCWIWEGMRKPGGAGRFVWNLREMTAHRASLALEGRRIPAGRPVLHKCGNPICVRPDHLYVPKAPPAVPVGDRGMEARFRGNFDATAKGCWPWRGAHFRDGRALFVCRGAARLAHRVAWEIARGPIPRGMIVVHTCGDVSCVRPDHLKLTSTIDRDGPIEERFWKNVRKTRGCWFWTGATLPSGYGVIRCGRRFDLAHRVAFRLERGPIGRGKAVLHRCATRECVRPDHLFLGTRRDVGQQMVERGRTRSALYPGSYPRGDAHVLHQHPELAARGEDVPRHVLTEDEVLEIRRRWAAEDVTQIQMSEEYGVDPSTISCVVREKTWRHLL